MGVPRFWRLQRNHYRLTGNVCVHCGNRAIGSRAVCPECQPTSPLADEPAYFLVWDLLLQKERVPASRQRR